MQRFHDRRATGRTRPSPFEVHVLHAGVLLIFAAAVVAVTGEDPGGTARVLGVLGLVAVGAGAASHGARLHRAGMTASLPTSVARVAVRARPRRAFNATTVGVALGLPLTALVVVVSVLRWGWIVAAAVLLLGSAAVLVTRARGADPHDAYLPDPSERGRELLGRLCMRADMRVPPLVVVAAPFATAWTAGGRIHVTRRLLTLLDDGELEAVLAHELAHLAHRDAAVMEVCSAPSRVLLAFSRSTAPWLVRWIRSKAILFPGGSWVARFLGAMTVFCVPPAFVIGWMSRVSLLGMSRAREFAADAAAVTLTGRPSALASALLKLERQGHPTPRSDLRHVEADAVLCIVGGAGSGLRRLLSTHPPTAARVRRLEEIERRIRGHA